MELFFPLEMSKNTQTLLLVYMYLPYKKLKLFVVQLLSSVRLFATPWTAAHTRLPCPLLSPGVCSNSCPLSQWYHPTTSSSSPQAFNLYQHQGLFQSKAEKILKLQKKQSPLSHQMIITLVVVHPQTSLFTLKKKKLRVRETNNL